jgi:hypothetical protein
MSITDSQRDDHFAPPQPAILAEQSDESSSHTIHGIAIGSGDVTRGRSKVRKLWPASTLKSAASTLSGRPLVRDHENTTKGSVGRVTDAKFQEGVGVLYQADLFDDALAQKVRNGQLEVSPRVVHTPVEELERDDETNAFPIDRAVFDNLSLVITGAAKSNTVEVGDTDEMSAEELEAAFADDGEPVDPADSQAEGEEAEGEGAEDDFGDSEPPVDDDEDDEYEPERASVDDGSDPTDESSDTQPENEVGTGESSANQPTRNDSDPIRMIVSESYSPTKENFSIMTDTVAIDAEYLPESADEFSKPVVIERSDLDELEAAAETDGDEYEELRAEMERLADAKEERDELRERVDELEEYEERLEEVDEMREALASDLAEDVDHFDADELSENFSVSELRSKIEAVDETADDADSESETEELDDEPEATEADEPDPAPRGGTETEELEAELTEEEQQRVADLEDTIEWYHDHNWDTAAEELEAELDELTADQ